MKRNSRGTFLSLMLFVALFFLIYTAFSGFNPGTRYQHEDFNKALSENRVAAVEIQPNSETPTGRVEVTLTSGETVYFFVSDTGEMEQELKKSFPEYTVLDVPRDGMFVKYMLPALMTGFVLFLLLILMNGPIGGGGGGNKMMNFGKSHARMSLAGEVKVTFKDVAGLQEEKEELEEIVDFLKDPVKYTKLGARIPKGVLLEGPPGTGKTLMAKAIAGEAGVPFFSISGSDFVEMFVGVGASRVRDLFQDAKKNAPCIVFIDEIDAVARRRGTGMGGGHDEREQTLNQLLVEMDGFGVNAGIIVIAATNRVDILDPAILRPGRFDRKIGVGRPDVKGRKEILEVHAKNKPLGSDVDLEQIARTSAGLTGADLENLLNEASILAAKNNRGFIKQADVSQAFIKVGIGAEKKSKVITEKDKKITAYHEAGHAILFHLLEGVGPVYMISIIPTGPGALGYTMPLPERDDVHMMRGQMLNHIMVSLGGRIAEQLIFEDYTSGASQDIKDATGVARNMVVKYGMSEKLGMVCYADDDDEVFIGRDLAHAKSISDATAAQIDEEVRRIIDECYAKAKALMIEHMDVLESCAQFLIENEKMTREQFEALFVQM